MLEKRKSQQRGEEERPLVGWRRLHQGAPGVSSGSTVKVTQSCSLTLRFVSAAQKGTVMRMLALGPLSKCHLVANEWILSECLGAQGH